jgi:hypothetical protein
VNPPLLCAFEARVWDLNIPSCPGFHELRDTHGEPAMHEEVAAGLRRYKAKLTCTIFGNPVRCRLSVVRQR